ncbi:MAG TPA: GNAT family N-acetyltransferase [Candidatus Angelobacter sp.]|nr:GNAT family N-acetyltransferase [Candidatus Angelobacter sp.]
MKHHSQAISVRIAEISDADPLSRLINQAFVVERPIFEGDRTNPDQVRSLMAKGKFLIASDSSASDSLKMIGCVYVEVRSDRGYVGLLSVDPSRQGSGLGRTLMSSAEEFFRSAKCVAADLRVVSPRTPLPAFYRHLGYVETHTSELPAEIRAKIPCHYVHMSKKLG